MIRHPKTSKPSQNSRGFALVIALSLMAFILVLLLGLTAFVRVESRTASIQLNTLQARQNALLGAMIALGDLQKYTGRDVGISTRAERLDSAPATTEIDDVANPNWTGVWSREPSTGQAKIETWLISGNSQTASTPPNFSPEDALTVGDNPITLRSENDAAEHATELSVPTVSIDNQGRYAFAAIGEQERVRINLESATSSHADNSPTFLPLRNGLEVLGEPGFDPRAEDLSRINYVTDLGLIPGAKQQFIEDFATNFSTKSAGLLTNSRDGGLKIDLTSRLENTTTTDSTPFVDFTEYGIPQNAFTTASPTWGYLRSFYEFKDEIAPASPGDPIHAVTPHPGTDQSHGVGPVIAEFSFGIAIGLRADNTVEYLWQPKVVLHNPYNVPLEASKYGIYFFGLAPTETSEPGHDPAGHSPMVLARFNYQYWVLGGESTSAPSYNYRDLQFHFARGFTWGTDIYRDTYDRERNGEPTGLDSVFAYSPGGPRFQIDAPRMEPGEAILFTPKSNRDSYVRMAPFNLSLAPGNRFNFFDYETPAELFPSDSPKLDPSRPTPNNLDYANIRIHLPDSDNTRYIDAVLTTIGSLPDNFDREGPPLYVWPNSGNRSRQMFRSDRADLAALTDDIYHMTGRIPYNHPDHYEEPIFNTLWYDSQIPAAAANSIAWTATGYSPTSPPSNLAYNPYRYFNPRGKFGDHADLKTRHANGRSQSDVFTDPTTNYFFEPFVGSLSTAPALETYGSLDDKVRIGGGLLNPVADIQVLYDLPRDSTGLYSLGQLQHVQFSQLSNEAGYAVGNSNASPLIPRESVFVQGIGVLSARNTTNHSNSTTGQWGTVDYSTIDLSYILNDAIWDQYFFATTADDARVNQVLSGTDSLPNPRLRPIEGATLAELQDPHKAAAHLLVDGAFNINTTSVEAWMTFLAGNHNRDLDGSPLESPFFRLFENVLADRDKPWSGFKEIDVVATSDPADPSPLRLLAEAIVEQVKLRGPFTSLADFVNRRIEDSPLGLSGALQTAIDTSGINDDLIPEAKPVDIDSTEFPFAEPDHFQGETADGIPGWLSQADILSSIGPFITTRNDTFTILAYGQTENAVTGNSASARLEMTVQRIPDYIDSTLPADEIPVSDSLNDRFGRRYMIVSMRWLANEL